MLRTSLFRSYLAGLIEKFPIIGIILSLFISPSHNRKYKAQKTHPKWRLWSDLYCSWLADMLLRARAPKSYGRTSVLLSAYFLLLSPSDPCWCLLQRLRVVVHKDTIKKYMNANVKFITSLVSVLAFVLDNCDYRIHVTHVRTENRTEVLNTINQFVMELPCLPIAVAARDIWMRFSDADFSKWIAATATESETFSSASWNLFLERPHTIPLRFMYRDTQSTTAKSAVFILPPLFNLQTLTYEDIEIVVQQFYDKYMGGSSRTFAFVSGDQQVWIKLWYLRMRQPVKYIWMIPVPGEWHWTWHILQGIFGHYTDSILLPFAKLLGFSVVDKKAKVFHYAEDLLEMVTIGVSKWVEGSMQRFQALDPEADSFNVIDWMHHIKNKNRNVYELVYACYYYFVPYWRTRSTIKWNKHEDMKQLWRWWIHLFIATRKTNYVAMSLRYLWIMEAMHPEIKALYNQFRVMSFSGEDGTGMPWDCYMELVYIYVFLICYLFNCAHEFII
jgi:hypothetical protein